MWFPVFCIWVFLSFIFAFDDDEDLMKRGKAISYPRFTQCGFLCNERPQCNFLLRNSKNPIFSSGSNFSSTSFPRRVKQVSASADGFWIIEIHDDHNDHDIDYDDRNDNDNHDYPNEHDDYDNQDQGDTT